MEKYIFNLYILLLLELRPFYAIRESSYSNHFFLKYKAGNLSSLKSFKKCSLPLLALIQFV